MSKWRFRNHPIRKAARKEIKRVEAEGNITFTEQEFKQMIDHFERVMRSEVSSAHQNGILSGS